MQSLLHRCKHDQIAQKHVNLAFFEQNIQRIEVEHGRQLEALNRRVSRVDHHTGRLDRRIDDLYEHFGIHLPYEEDNDDDEDQD